MTTEANVAVSQKANGAEQHGMSNGKPKSAHRRNNNNRNGNNTKKNVDGDMQQADGKISADGQKRELKKVDPAVKEQAMEMLKAGKRAPKPDQEQYGKTMEELDRELEQVKKLMDQVRSQIEAESGSQSHNDQRAQLKAALDAVRAEQQEHEGRKGLVVEALKAASETLRMRQDELKSAKEKLPFKTPGDIDRRASELEAQVESGTLKIVEEKRILGEITALKKLKKQSDQFAPMEQNIELEKKRVDELRDHLSTFDPESRRFKQAFGKTLGELRAVEQEGRENKSKLDKIYSERSALHKQQNDILNKKRAASREYYAKKDLFYAFMTEERKLREKESRKEREEADRKKKLERIQEAKEEAAIPAFQVEIKSCTSLIKMMNNIAPSEDPKVAEAIASSGGLGKDFVQGSSAKVAREVRADAILPKGFSGVTALKKKSKDDEEDGVLRIGGKKKAGSARPASPSVKTSEKVLKLDLTILDQLQKLKIAAPSNVTEVPKTIDALLAKRAYFIENQDRVTKENIKKVNDLEKKLLKEEEDRVKKAEAATASATENSQQVQESVEDDSAAHVDQSDVKEMQEPEVLRQAQQIQ